MNAHLGNEQYKKDDLESLAYMMIFFIKGELPWQNIKAKSRKEKYTKIYQKKKNTVNSELCNFLPDEIKSFVNYILNLNQKQNPDYEKLMNLISNLMKKYGYNNDLQFDWYSPSFIQKLYSVPMVDDGENIKSSSIYEEESTKSEKKKLRNKSKKKNNNINNIKKVSNIINNMNEFDLIYNKNIVSMKNIKQNLNLENKDKKEEYKKLLYCFNNNNNLNNERRYSPFRGGVINLGNQPNSNTNYNLVNIENNKNIKIDTSDLEKKRNNKIENKKKRIVKV